MRGAFRPDRATPSRQENWEEKRRRLLQQKKQLEVERERIQARLALQEEKLSLQNQQLRQSYLHYSRYDALFVIIRFELQQKWMFL